MSPVRFPYTAQASSRLCRGDAPTPARRASASARPGLTLPRARVAALVLLGIVATSAAATGQSAPPAPTGSVGTGIIAGTVEDSLATPVAGARITILGMTGHGVSGDDGTFRLAGIQPGTHTLVARRIGFRPESVSVSIAAATVTDVRVRIRRSAQWVAPVVINARTARYTGALRAFYERRDRGMGLYFTAEDIAERDPRYVTDLLRTVPGTRIIPRGSENVVTFRDLRCLPLIWIDGNAANAGYLDPDVFDPHSLAGIEVYKGPSTVPAALMSTGGRGSCGVIALWTKRQEPKPKVAAKPVTAEDLANLVASLSLYTADQVDEPVRVLPDRPISPVYPDLLLSTGAGGRVVVEFVVDTSGRADMNTFGVISTTHGPFTESVRRAVADAAFSPAVREGRPVRQLVQLPFSFTAPKS